MYKRAADARRQAESGMLGSTADIWRSMPALLPWKDGIRPFRPFWLARAHGWKWSEVEGPGDDREHCLEQVQCGEQEALGLYADGVARGEHPDDRVVAPLDRERTADEQEPGHG